ncbi:MAG: hypothetical protein ACI868_000727, partial [Granulosicoccus sp.]
MAARPTQLKRATILFAARTTKPLLHLHAGSFLNQPLS